MMISEPKPLVLIEMSRLGRLFGLDAVPWLFYYATVLSTETAQTEGVTLLHKICDVSKRRLEFLPGIWNVVRQALPVRVKSNIVVPILDESQKHLADYLAVQACKIIEYNSGSSPDVLNLHTADARLQALEAKGISKCCLPPCIGGTLNEKRHHDEWIRSRLSIEETFDSVFLNSRARFGSAPNPTTALVAADTTRARPASKKSNDQDLAPKQRAHQRWLEKERLKKNALNEQYKMEKTHNAQLLATHQKLTNLLAQAKYIVALHNSHESDATALQTSSWK